MLVLGLKGGESHVQPRQTILAALNVDTTVPGFKADLYSVWWMGWA